LTRARTCRRVRAVTVLTELLHAVPTARRRALTARLTLPRTTGVVGAVALLARVHDAVAAAGTRTVGLAKPRTCIVDRTVAGLTRGQHAIAALGAAPEDARRELERTRTRQARNGIDRLAHGRRNAERRGHDRGLRARRSLSDDRIEEALPQTGLAGLP